MLLFYHLLDPRATETLANVGVCLDFQPLPPLLGMALKYLCLTERHTNPAGLSCHSVPQGKREEKREENTKGWKEITFYSGEPEKHFWKGNSPWPLTINSGQEAAWSVTNTAAFSYVTNIYTLNLNGTTLVPTSFSWQQKTITRYQMLKAFTFKSPKWHCDFPSAWQSSSARQGVKGNHLVLRKLNQHYINLIFSRC